MAMSPGDRRSALDGIRGPDEGTAHFPVEANLSASNAGARETNGAASDGEALELFASETGDARAVVGPADDETDVRKRSEDSLRSVRERLVSASAKVPAHRSILRRITASRIAATRFGFEAGSLLTSRIRDYLVQHPKLTLRAASIACVLIAAVIVRDIVGGSEAVPPPAVVASVASEPGADSATVRTERIPPPHTAAAEPAPPATNVRTPQPVRRAAPPQPKIATAPAKELNRARAPLDEIRRGSIARQGGAEATRGLQSPTPAAATIGAGAVPAAPPLSPTPNPQATIENDASSNVVYSDRDKDVRPPQMLDSELPRPTVPGWSTATNTMELIIAENGSVERVKLLTAPQRMPDVMLLSRAKLWRFAPAVKGGHPVRYRLVMTWEVNP
jgi:hypothetical protein